MSNALLFFFWGDIKACSTEVLMFAGVLASAVKLGGQGGAG